MMNNVEFRALRSKAELTQAQVARRSHVDHTRVCMWEKGNIALHPAQVASLEKALLDLIRESAEQLNKLVRESRQSATA
jgi:DNA-binding transcriptional regulator YiaG